MLIIFFLCVRLICLIMALLVILSLIWWRFCSSQNVDYIFLMCNTHPDNWGWYVWKNSLALLNMVTFVLIRQCWSYVSRLKYASHKFGMGKWNLFENNNQFLLFFIFRDVCANQTLLIISHLFIIQTLKIGAEKSGKIDRLRNKEFWYTKNYSTFSYPLLNMVTYVLIPQCWIYVSPV